MCKQLPKAQVGLRTQTPTPEGPGGSGQALLSGAQHRAGSEPPNLKLQTPLATCSPHCCFPFPAKAASLSFMFFVPSKTQASLFLFSFLKEKHSHSEGKQTKLNSCYLIAVGSVLCSRTGLVHNSNCWLWESLSWPGCCGIWLEHILVMSFLIKVVLSNKFQHITGQG